MIAQDIIELILSSEDIGNLTVSNIACIVGIERYTLSRIFKKETEVSLEYYLNNERMIRAAQMLVCRPELTIKKKKKILGYCTCDYFILRFNKHFLITPGKYRELSRKRKQAETVGIKDRLKKEKVTRLKQLARQLKLKGHSKLKKQELIDLITLKPEQEIAQRWTSEKKLKK